MAVIAVASANVSSMFLRSSRSPETGSVGWPSPSPPHPVPSELLPSDRGFARAPLERHRSGRLRPVRRTLRTARTRPASASTCPLAAARRIADRDSPSRSAKLLTTTGGSIRRTSDSSLIDSVPPGPSLQSLYPRRTAPDRRDRPQTGSRPENGRSASANSRAPWHPARFSRRGASIVALARLPDATRRGGQPARRAFLVAQARPRLLLLDVSEDGIQIVVEPGCQPVSYCPQFGQDWVSVHRPLLSTSTSSSGVHSTGGPTPARRQTNSIRGLATAFAMCRKFHVTRNSTLWTAAMATCIASRAARSGTAPASTSRRASSRASIGAASAVSDASASRRARDAPGSPTAASSRTSWEIKRSNRVRAVFHQSRVACWRPAITMSRAGRAVR